MSLWTRPSQQPNVFRPQGSPKCLRLEFLGPQPIIEKCEDDWHFDMTNFVLLLSPTSFMIENLSLATPIRFTEYELFY